MQELKISPFMEQSRHGHTFSLFGAASIFLICSWRRGSFRMSCTS